MLKNKKIYTMPIVGFLLMILITTLLLKLPICNNKDISYIDSFFEATSAVSATGSNVVDLSAQFNFLGQLVILIAMQIGAVGFMLFFSLLILISRKKLKLSDTIFLGNEINTNNYTTIKNKAKKITRYTLVIELFGTWLLSLRFIPIYGFKTGLWMSVFHSVSAFCNVGSDLTGNSLVMFQNDFYMDFCFMLLMFCGSIGFFVIEDFVNWYFTGKKKSVHVESKMVLNMSFLIIIVGVILVKILNPELTFLQTIFTVITARNTGFYTVDINCFNQINQFIISIIMFIGGAPGSNSGGIRVIVFAVLVLTTISNIRNRDDVVIFYRSINDKTIKKAISILSIDMLIVFLGIVAFSITDERSLLDTLFYITSTFSNTGLSTFDVSEISFMGKLISIFIMYIGRIAPITFVSLFIPNISRDVGIRYPNMDVML